MNDAETDTEQSAPAEPRVDVDGSVETDSAHEPKAGQYQAEPMPEVEQTEATSDEQPAKISDAFSASAKTHGSLRSTDLSLMSAVQVELTLNVGSKSMAIADVLNLAPGSVVTLNRREHDPLDILINGIVFARGEVVRTGDYYGLRILEIL